MASLFALVSPDGLTCWRQRCRTLSDPRNDKDRPCCPFGFDNYWSQSVTEQLTHIKRTQLPWRTDDGLTECGRDAAGYLSVTRDDALVQFKKLGQQRFALVTCMTCMSRTNVQYRAEVDGDMLPVIFRELQRVQYKEGDEAHRRL